MAKRIPVLSEEADYGVDRSLAGSLGLRGPTEYEWELVVLLCGFITFPDKSIV